MFNIRSVVDTSEFSFVERTVLVMLCAQSLLSGVRAVAVIRGLESPLVPEHLRMEGARGGQQARPLEQHPAHQRRRHGRTRSGTDRYGNSGY